MGSQQTLTGPDLARGVALDSLEEGVPLLGHFEHEAVLLVRRGTAIFAAGAVCTHYSGPLAEGLVVGETIRCPWHHARFSLRTGEALAAPALNAIATYRTEVRADRVHVVAKIASHPQHAAPAAQPRSIVIVGAGAAGSAAAEMLRRRGYPGELTLIDADRDAPYDRPNLSKDYLAGSATEEWLPLWPSDFCAQHNITRVHENVTRIDVSARSVEMSDGGRISYDALLLATGARPRTVALPGSELPHVHVLRSLRDCRAIIDDLQNAHRAVVLGSSFIGLEVAASLRARKLDVAVVAPEAVPFERVFGAELGLFVRQLHEDHGVQFHLGKTAARITEGSVQLSDDTSIAADVVVIGIGVTPILELAEAAGIHIDKGVVVNRFMQTSVPGIYAAGDVARWPDPHSGELIRVEHWVVAQRQGQAAARNMLGAAEPFAHVPFFWTQHYDATLSYLGHASAFSEVISDGDARKLDYSARLLQNGEEKARITIFRDRESLEREAELELR